MDLQIKNSSVPLRGWAQNDLDKFLQTDFKIWLASTFRIKTENAVGLNAALEGVKSHCWSMGFGEIKKAFELYADSKLNLEPVSGFMDRILVGKIIKAYKDNLPTSKTPVIEPKEVSEKERNEIMEKAVLRLETEFLLARSVPAGSNHVYDYLDETGKIQFTSSQKWDFMKQAKQKLIDGAKDVINLDSRKSFLNKLEDKNNGIVKAEAKRLALLEYLTDKYPSQ